MSSLKDLLTPKRAKPKAAIVLQAVTEMPRPRRGPGRPRKHPKDTPIGAYYKGRTGRGRPRCARVGCETLLRVHQALVCSDACGDVVFNQAMRHLRLLEVTPKQILAYFAKDKDLAKTG